MGSKPRVRAVAGTMVDRAVVERAMPPAVEAAYARFPAEARATLLGLRDLIFEVANETDGVGRLTETLKWGEPSYLTEESKSGTTIRLGCTRQGACALYVHCQTTLVSQFREWFGDALEFEGNRAVLVPTGEPLLRDVLRQCIAAALTYHS